MLQVYLDELAKRLTNLNDLEVQGEYYANEYTLTESARDYADYPQGTYAHTNMRRVLNDAEQKRHVYRRELNRRGIEWRT
jgi:hypothetical protein